MVDWSWVNVRSIIWEFWEIFSEIFDRNKCVWEIKYFLQDLKSLPLDSDQEPNPVGMSPVRTRILTFHRRRHCEAPAFSLSTPRTLIPWKLRRIPSNSFCWNLLPISILFQISLLKKKRIVRNLSIDLQLPGASSKLSFFLLFPNPILFNWSSIRRFAFWKVRPTLKKS